MYSVGLDVGTTSCKICVLSSSTNEQKHLVFTEQLAHEAHITQNDKPSFDEQCPLKIFEIVNSLLEKSGCFRDDFSIKPIQISGQMHGLVFWSSKSPETIFSPLVTWQDQRCSTEFLASLDSSLKHLRTGYGLATLLWLIDQQKTQDDQLMKYDRAGTIADYVVARLCHDSIGESQISTQMATSWGAQDNQWPVQHRLLPKIVEPGTVYGYWKKDVPVYVALGDLQCSVFSCQPKDHEGIVNLSTSAQLALIVDKQENAQGDQLSSSMRVPYFQSKDLLVAASLNGGNVLSAFVRLIYSWQTSLNTESPITIDQIWSRLIQLALQSSSTTTTLEHFSAALFGERHDPSLSAFITNIRSMNLFQLNDIGLVFRSICHWIIHNLFEMLGENTSQIEGIIGTGSALMRNQILQNELNEKVNGSIKYNENSDAAYGAALFALKQ